MRLGSAETVGDVADALAASGDRAGQAEAEVLLGEFYGHRGEREREDVAKTVRPSLDSHVPGPTQSGRLRNHRRVPIPSATASFVQWRTTLYEFVPRYQFPAPPYHRSPWPSPPHSSR